jgi:hypothetical protein
MEKNILKGILLLLSIPAVLVSCVKEQAKPKPEPEVQVQGEAGHRVTISAGLPAQTKMTHELVGTSIRPLWEAGDQVSVVFVKDKQVVIETFELLKGEGTTNAIFFKDDSQLGDNTPFSVHYPATETGWGVQDGTVEALPESLAAHAQKLGDELKLKSALTYFHVVIDKYTGGDCAYAHLNKLEGDCTLYSAPGVKGSVSVAPQGGFSNGKVDFYVAVLLDGPTTGTVTDEFDDTVPVKFQIAFGDLVQGISFDNQAIDLTYGSQFTWTPEKEYVPGTVYKIENKPMVKITKESSQPR